MTLPITFEVEIGTRAVEMEIASNEVTVSPGTPQVVVVASPGAPGQPGPPGDGVQVLGESPSGVKNGSNLVFTVADSYRESSTAVYLNGLRETYYSESGPAEITFEDAPLPGDSITIDYILIQEGPHDGHPIRPAQAGQSRHSYRH